MTTDSQPLLEPERRIEIISASAGTGKTTRLARLLEREVAAERVRPESVVATTFTNKAAAELQQRVRARLLAAGHVEQAQRLGASRMGTVNAICDHLVSEFAFELGLAPDLRVLDEVLAERALKRSLARVITRAHEEELSELGLRLDSLGKGSRWGRARGWVETIEEVVALARTNAIDAADLSVCAQRSIDGFRVLLGPVSQSARQLDDGLAAALAGFLEGLEGGEDTTKKTAKARTRAEGVLNRLRRGLAVSWADWLRMARLDVGAKSRHLAEPVWEAAHAHDGHPRLHDDVERAIELIFGIAARALATYEEYKRSRGAIDFVDQEVLALDLLGRDSVRDQLAGEIDLVLVDEFQDTSPIQLAIFLKLAEISPRSVWVGDQKQAIYGFRGTDPALMDAAMEVILGQQKPETLDRSWRSRPGLVQITSDLFTPAFAQYRIPSERVRLSAGLEETPQASAALGAVVECWQLRSTNLEDDVGALAAGVRDLLAGPDLRVRSGRTREPRRARAGDVAVLCRLNTTCERVASALGAFGVPVALPRAGLMSTPEASLVSAGLRFWVDPSDQLARAEIARLTWSEEESAPDGWLSALLEREGWDLFRDRPGLARLVAARESRPLAGPVAALDAVIEALDVREWCLGWGDAPSRLANLDALRALAIDYVEAAAADGTGCTATGLVLHLDQLARLGLDGRALTVDQEAVEVLTWHRAKGLEWPITILFDLSRDEQASPLGVHVASDRPAVDLAAPLADRWIRYWPGPYLDAQKHSAFHERLAAHPASAEAQRRARAESLRLLYVGWTRARDRLVLAVRKGKFGAGMLSALAEAEGARLASPDFAGEVALVTWAGAPRRVRTRRLAPADPVAAPAESGAGYEHFGPLSHPLAFVSPSALEEVGEVVAVERIGRRLPLSGRAGPDALGEAVHGFLAADRPGLSEAERLRMSRNLLHRWQVLLSLSPDALLHASAALRRWADGRWEGAHWHREWPVVERSPDGSIVRGTADLVLETEDGFVLVDHKSYPGSVEQATEHARAFAGQLAAYASAIRAASGRPVLGTFIHLPIVGIVVEVATP